MKKLLPIIFLFCGYSVVGQTYSNDWIDYSKPYYKFKVINEGIYRIPFSTLQRAGLAGTPSEQFQLWHNGEQQPLYLTRASGTLNSGDYIEFYGQINDGKFDKKLYRITDFQLSDHKSLISDTAAYFLTVTATGGNLRFADAANDVSSNTLPADKYFMNKKSVYYENQVNPGYGLPVGGVYIYSSAYDEGEGWGSASIGPGESRALTSSVNDLHLYPSGPPASFTYAAVGNAYNSRNIKVKFNNTFIDDAAMPNFQYLKKTIPTIPISLFSSTTQLKISFQNTSGTATDRMIVSYWTVTYPSTFDFDNKKNFEFELGAAPQGNFLEILNFNNGSTAPVLYDLTNLKRYVAVLADGKIKFALPPSTQPVRKLRLVSESSDAVRTINALTTRNFIDFSNSANQGDYIIISNPALFTSLAGKNYVDEYRQYRASAQGGGFNAKLIDINELEDQFAYGIWRHPLSIKEFIQFAADKFDQKPQFIFLIGKGVDYLDASRGVGGEYIGRLNLVPTFGSPASDNLLSAGYGGVVTPRIPIGRLSAITGDEVGNYFEKIQEYDAQQQSTDYTLEDKLWNKTNVQIIGGSNSSENGDFRNFMYGYKMQVEDSLLGMKVETFSKTSSEAVQTASSGQIKELFKNGIGLLSYFGHSSASTLEYNLDDPENYENPGKYPIFIVSGCIAGNNFTYDTMRIVANRTTISENFVLSKQRGSIVFVASTHYGIPKYLNDYNTDFYNQIGKIRYGQAIGNLVKETVREVGGDDPMLQYYKRADAEEMAINGDPAVKLLSLPKPDYVIEDQSIRINPAFISVSSLNFTVNAVVHNLGRAIGDSITWEVKRTFPDGRVNTIYRSRKRAPYYADSIKLTIPIASTSDKGANKITVTIDADNDVDEMSESNNSFTKEFFIFEDEATPVYPQNFGIVNKYDDKMFVSTADPMSAEKDYIFQIDTTELFNSQTKVSKQINSKGGIIEFDPGFDYKDGTVYYWRVMVKNDTTNEENGRWNTASFIYLNNGTEGANMSHYYQHMYSTTEDLNLNEDRVWEFTTTQYEIKINGGVYPTALTQGSETSVAVNDVFLTSGICNSSGMVITILDPITLKPWENTPGTGRYGSKALCGVGRIGNFEYLTTDVTQRMAAYHLLHDTIPNGTIVAIRHGTKPNLADNPTGSFAADWLADTAVLGPGNSLYHELLNNGFTAIDSFNKPMAYLFIYQKNNDEFVPTYVLSEGTGDKITLLHDFTGPDTLGFVHSPKFGPATSWKELVWEGEDANGFTTSDAKVSVIGIRDDGTESLLAVAPKDQKTVDISNVDANEFPYARLELRNSDSIHFQAYQLKYWRLSFVPAPEGGLQPLISFKAQDTVMQNESLRFEIAFRNLSNELFDSVKVKVQIIDKNNVTHNISVPRQKMLESGDTIWLKLDVDTKTLSGNNTLNIDFNPDEDQPEQFHFNNFLFHDFYVLTDEFNPLLDVTFDGVHILNRDIVSARPHIVIKLEDENRFARIKDTSLVKVQLSYPVENGPNQLRTIYFDNDTLRFTPAGPDENSARIDFTPAFEDAVDDEYELIVSGRDPAGNQSGSVDYHVTFRVINKAMITEVLNYPNPFTTSTAFVFTLTGSEVPQNLRIQIMTVTGKIVKEITREELGPIHIGRNITEYKWDGTDMYGQKLANGVYLYRVLTNLNGKSLDKFNDKDFQLDPSRNFFRSGYGKMYLMR